MSFRVLQPPRLAVLFGIKIVRDTKSCKQLCWLSRNSVYERGNRPIDKSRTWNKIIRTEPVYRNKSLEKFRRLRITRGKKSFFAPRFRFSLRRENASFLGRINFHRYVVHRYSLRMYIFKGYCTDSINIHRRTPTLAQPRKYTSNVPSQRQLLDKVTTVGK